MRINELSYEANRQAQLNSKQDEWMEMENKSLRERAIEKKVAKTKGITEYERMQQWKEIQVDI